jgi:hypothetical protein
VLNACELQIDLFCNGLRLGAGVSIEGARAMGGARAGHASGLELAIPSTSWVKRVVWMNAPIGEPFIERSPYHLTGSQAAGYAIHDERSGDQHRIRVPRQPNWYNRLTSRDVPMSHVGTMQGTHLAISLDPVCAFWNSDPALNCGFCNTGRTASAGEHPQQTLEDVVETCWAAKEESRVTFVEFTSGFQGEHGIASAERFVRTVKQDVGVLVGVQLAPERHLSHYDGLFAAGVDRVSFCVDLIDPDWFARICPGKALVLGRSLFFEAMEYCAARLPRGAVFGQLIAGVEPAENTIRGIERIAAAGALPSVSIFRPLAGAGMADWSPPAYDDMRGVMAQMYEICRRYRLPIGMAPNIEPSVVVSPDDAALLAPKTRRFYLYELWRRSLRLASRPVFASRQRAIPRRISVDSPSEIGAGHRR